MKSYCERRGIDEKSVKFLFDGTRINAENTPKQLEMEDGDAIDVFQEQQGGAF